MNKMVQDKDLSNSRLPIYLDHNATTPLDSNVLAEMMPYFTEKFGNASSTDHRHGHDASEAVESAREDIANTINAKPGEIVFTAGATESDNMALVGVMNRYADKGDHLITCVTEHKAVLDVARYLESVGKKVTYLPVDELGHVNLDELHDAVTDKTVMISIMTANNEIGTIADVESIGKIAHENDILFHTDAAQAVGHIPMDVQKMNIDLMSFSAHKMYGPKGIGALYVSGIKPRVQLDPIVRGGGQEHNMRSGTLNVPGIVGFGKAASIAATMMYQNNQDQKQLAVTMLKLLEENGWLLNGDRNNRLSGNLNVCHPGIDGKAIINSVSKQIAISAGSACTTQNVEPSHVITALGYGEERAYSSIRIGIGRYNVNDETEFAAGGIIEAVRTIKRFNG